MSTVVSILTLAAELGSMTAEELLEASTVCGQPLIALGFTGAPGLADTAAALQVLADGLGPATCGQVLAQLAMELGSSPVQAAFNAAGINIPAWISAARIAGTSGAAAVASALSLALLNGVDFTVFSDFARIGVDGLIGRGQILQEIFAYAQSCSTATDISGGLR